jgi:hypothetical protein
MAKDTKTAETLEDVGQLAEKGSPSGRRPWIGRSATERVCDMARVQPASVPAEAASIRALLRKVRPAANGMSPKTWANVVSRLRVELRLAGVIDANNAGLAARHPAWATLAQAISEDKGLSNGFCRIVRGAGQSAKAHCQQTSPDPFRAHRQEQGVPA